MHSLHVNDDNEDYETRKSVCVNLCNSQCKPLMPVEGLTVLLFNRFIFTYALHVHIPVHQSSIMV